MKKIERRAMVCRILAAALVLGLGIFLWKWVAHGGSWASSAFNRHMYNSEGLLASGTILDRDGDVLSTIVDGKRVYYDNADVRKATLHVVGDRQGNIGTSALTAFGHKLTGYNIVNGAYGASHGGKLYLTIDARYNYEAYKALNGKKGTVAVYNYKTGEILCLVSSPTFDPVNVPSNLTTDERYEGVFLNRFLSSTFPPGSTFKTVTLAAALETFSDLHERTWTCEGKVRIGDDVITCSGRHGTQNIEQAFANSCNVAFAQLAAELGADTMQVYTEKAGLTNSYSVSGLPTAKGTFQFSGTTPSQLGWAGIGQYHDQVNPCSMMLYMGAIANGGTTAQPYLVKRTVGAIGIPSLPHIPKQTDTLIEEDTAQIIADMMANNVVKTYGASRFPNMDICAKSGTAEVSNGEPPHAWFAGFLRDEEYPYAFIVLAENGGSGATTAGNVAAKVLNAMINGY